MGIVGTSKTGALSAELRAAVAQELERVIASEYFRNSKQAERLLRYLVANSLEDQDERCRHQLTDHMVHLLRDSMLHFRCPSGAGRGLRPLGYRANLYRLWDRRCWQRGRALHAGSQRFLRQSRLS